MGTTFTPTDSGLATLELSRRPDLGNARDFDAGNVVVFSAGSVSHVLDKPPRTRGQVLRFTGITSAERLVFDTYVDDVLDQSVESFHLAWGDRVNLLTDTRRLDRDPTPWQLLGPSPSRTYGVADPRGGMAATRLDFLAGAPGDTQRLVQALGTPASSGVAYSAGVWLRLADGPSMAGSVKLQARTDAQIHSLDVTPTTAWAFHATTAAAFTLGLTNLAWRVYRTDSPSPGSDFSIDLWAPQLMAGQATPATYQHVEREWGMSRLRLAGPPRWLSRAGDDLWDLELALLAVGGS